MQGIRMHLGTPDERSPVAEELLEEDDRPVGSKSRFLVSLGKPQLAALREYADKKGLSVAEVVRRAVDEFFDRRSVSSDGPASSKRD
jgi:hypothetical protein